MTGDVEVLPMDAEQALVLRLSGTLDTGTAAAALARLLDSTVTLPPPHLVILDLRDVGTLSAAGVRALGEFAVRRARRGPVGRPARPGSTEHPDPARRAARGHAARARQRGRSDRPPRRRADVRGTAR